MSKYRQRLPQLNGKPFLTDGGLETTLIYLEGLDLPLFAAFDLLKDDRGLEVLRRYYQRYAALAREAGTGLVLETPTWRANPDWGARLGYDAVALADANRRAVGLMLEVRERFETRATPCVISGNVGPRGDGYQPGAQMTAAAARRYHRAQIDTFAQTDADLVSGFTINYLNEAIGIVQAAADAGMPVVVSFTVETDGRLPDGHSLGEAIEAVDRATDAAPVYFMINCAHPSHFDHALAAQAPWLERIGGLRVNASRLSHAELDAAETLDRGDPVELAALHEPLVRRLRNLRVLGGCCGTDHQHVEAIGRAVLCTGEARDRSERGAGHASGAFSPVVPRPRPRHG